MSVERSLFIDPTSKVLTSKVPKSGKARRVPIGPDLVERLKLLERSQRDRAIAEHGLRIRSVWVISPTGDGLAAIRPDGFRARFDRWRQVAGVTCRFHDLRHFAAATMLAAGVDVRTVADILGHADVAVTLRMYAHTTPGGMADAADAIRRALVGGY